MASVDIAIVVDSPPSTGITVVNNGPFVAPVASGTVIATVQVKPADWQGVLVLSGPNEADFTLSAPVNGAAEIINPAVLNTVETENITITAAP